MVQCRQTYSIANETTINQALTIAFVRYRIFLTALYMHFVRSENGRIKFSESTGLGKKIGAELGG